MKTAIPYLLSTALCLPILCSEAGAGEANTLSYSGSLVGHSLQIKGNPDQIYNQSGALITHPFAAGFTGYYTVLNGTDAFDFDAGGELALGSNPVNGTVFTNSDAPSPSQFVATLPAGHGLSNGAVTATDSNPVHIAVAGFALARSRRALTR